MDCSQSNDLTKKFTACLWTNNGDKNQRFIITRRDNQSDYFIVRNVLTGTVLQVKDSKINNGAKIVFA